MEEKVVLVDENDNFIGLMPKMKAHELGVLHRAFSVFLFNDKDELLLQRRAISKYHSGGLWTNTCCSHQRDGENNIDAGKRRLKEEMGIVTELEESFSFIYKKVLDKGLTEHEYDYVLIGRFNDEPVINKEEVEDWKYISISALTVDIKENPNNYTEWFKICLKKVIQMQRKIAA